MKWKPKRRGLEVLDMQVDPIKFPHVARHPGWHHTHPRGGPYWRHVVGRRRSKQVPDSPACHHDSIHDRVGGGCSNGPVDGRSWCGTAQDVMCGPGCASTPCGEDPPKMLKKWKPKRRALEVLDVAVDPIKWPHQRRPAR